MPTTNPLKTALLLVALLIAQGVLFTLYVEQVWPSPLALVGMVGLPLGLLLNAYQRQRHWLARAGKVTGRITGHQRKVTYRNHGELLTVDYVLYGRPYTYYANRSSAFPVPPMGSSVDLLYNPDQPADVQ